MTVVGRALHLLEAFCSHHGADFYGLPRGERKVRLLKKHQDVPASYPFGLTKLVPLRAGEQVAWTLSSS